jgi:HD-like signal output (HDOD) protein
MTFEHIIKNIDSLPPLSNAAHIIQTLYAGGLENLNIARLVKVIESDAMLSANILRMINAPYYGIANKISSISQAVSLFGSSRIYMLVIQYAVNEKIKADPSIYGFTNSQFNELCHLQSALIYQWYSKVNLSDAKFLAPLALMMESGKLILANEVIKSDYCGEFRKGFNECTNIQEYEKSLIDTTSYFLTAILFEHWNLEPKYVEILKALDFEEESPRYKKELEVIRTAINVKEILTDSSISRASQLVKDMGLDAQQFRDVALRLKESYLS